MIQLLDPLLIVALALNFVALGGAGFAGHQRGCRSGVLLGILALFVHPEIGTRVILLVAVTVGVKGFVIPRFLVHALREANIQDEVKPGVVNFMGSLLLGAVGTGLAMVFSDTLPLAEQHKHLLLVPASLSTVWTGFLMLTTRKRAIMQVLGYLLLENGIFLFGLLLLEATPFLVEVGILLDLFTGVFVMGIIIHHISREFASTSTEHLTELKE
jgi:hydrogenase-4 component E